MDLRPSPFKVKRYGNHLHQSLKEVSEKSMERAAEEATKLNSGITTVRDDSCQKTDY
jgi:hypothetical protein